MQPLLACCSSGAIYHMHTMKEILKAVLFVALILGLEMATIPLLDCLHNKFRRSICAILLAGIKIDNLQ